MRNTNAKSFKAVWIESLDYKGGVSDNLLSYRKVLQTMTPEKAVWETFSGKQAKKHGFQNATIREIKNGVEVIFTK